ncbi:Glycosyltransferase involved in cell wall bisynthesis [Lutimaribacter pacificus]|uniref:Glycosyltransferase involved in cell wall bisynthesis n=1 Tax=Lutimaribacter pacificus TaxID=391948 RepID=A0A1H0CM13_9RHOB|nr:glycosyltransferase family A protein [Lutimaribacter pacificus]SDN58885.1 Glycosyltransferase involved in cell wall bisynthesis [Lutimaribacter pacificus]SHJ43104.1 Glycosyltransferase involved in cell wall bisynthesis [Lutimaribacter pacificus]
MSLGVGVVIPARNAEKTLAGTIESILACRGVEQIVIVDDKSTDGTREIALSFPDDRIEVVSGPGNGISAALNAGFDRLRTPYAMRCDADDTVPADRLEWQVPLLEENSDLIAVSAGFETMLDGGIMCGTLACKGKTRDVTDILRGGEPVTSFCTWLTRTDAIRKVGGARSWFRTAEDVDLMFRLAVEGRVLHVPRVAYHYLMHDASIVHSTSNSTRFFFDEHATKFVRDRCLTGSDALERGEDLPDWPPVVHGEMRPALQQGISHAVATAWAEADRGDYASALRRISRVWRKAPFEKKLLTAYFKILGKRYLR